MAGGETGSSLASWSSPLPRVAAGAAPRRRLSTLACALPRPSLWPPSSVALALSAGPSPSPGASSWGGTRLPHGASARPGSWQRAGGSLSMLHLFIDRALPQLLFQSPASCRRLIREGGAGSQAQSCHPELGGNTQSPPACLPAELPFLSPECPARPQFLGTEAGPVAGAPLG